MSKLVLSNSEKEALRVALAKAEARYGKDYTFKPEKSAFSCKCSGPAQSCVWH